MNAKRFWATRCAHWGRAIWKTKPRYSATFRQFMTDPEGPPLASDNWGNTGWVVNLFLPEGEDLRKDVDHLCIEITVEIRTGRYALGFGGRS